MKKNEHALLSDRLQFPYYLGEGCKNTFLIFDCLSSTPSTVQEVLQEAHAMLLQKKRDDALVLRMVQEEKERIILEMIVVEPDGSYADFCGNGARVVACYLKHAYEEKRAYYLQTKRGKRKIFWDERHFWVDMGMTRFYLRKNGFFQPAIEPFYLGLGMRQFTFFWTETIEPHLVTFDKMSDEELHALGMYINMSQRDFFPKGVNLNRVERTDKAALSIRTFERGVNRITEACGTGATSCAMLALELQVIPKTDAIKVFLKGGEVSIILQDKKVFLVGPAYLE